MKDQSYRSKAINKFMSMGMTKEEASREWKRFYDRTRPLKYTGLNKPFEAYKMITNDIYSARTTRQYYKEVFGVNVPYDIIEKQMTQSRLGDFMAKYNGTSIYEDYKDYLDGKITLSQLSDKIEDFKKDNTAYQGSSSN